MLRRLGILAVIGIVISAALLSGSIWIWFLLYLVGTIFGLAYLLARRGLTNLEAGAWLDRRHATVGDTLTVTYTLRSSAALPKPWLEVHSPSTLPVAIPGRVIALGPRTSRTWAARVPLPARGQYRVEPMVIRTGDPFSLFESVATVGPGASLLVYPRVAALPAWTLPPAVLEGASARARHGAPTAPLATSVRPYTPSDAFNRIHWRSSARHQELQVKEFDIEPSADLWIFLDLDRSRHVGSGPAASVETAIEVAAALAAHALGDGRGVGLEAIGLNRAVVNVDRGPRQQHKIMSLLAVAQATGSTPLAEMLLEGNSRVRRGMIALAITPSLDPTWVPPLSALRATGVAPIACLIDPATHVVSPTGGAAAGTGSPSGVEGTEQARRALLHVLAEHDVHAHVIRPGLELGEQLIGGRGTADLAA
jgi:uncharacterized protein (DUF58 family)